MLAFHASKLGLAFWSYTLRGVGAPSLDMTFVPCHAPPLAWQRPSSPVQSVNEVEDPGGMVGTVWLEERMSVCERLLIGICTQVVWLWWGCGGMSLTSFVPFGVVQAVLYCWHCLWTSGGLPVVGQNFLGNGHP